MDLLPHLPLAGGDHHALGLVEIQHPVIPRQAEELEHAARPALLVGDQPLVRHLEEVLRGQHGAPVARDAHVLAVVVGQVRQVIGPRTDVEEVLEVDRERGVQRVALHVDDACAREGGVDESCVHEVCRHLVDDPRGPATGGAHALKVTARHVRDQRQGLPPLHLGLAPGLVGAVPVTDFPAAEHLRVEARICSVSEVPERGMPTMNTGSSELRGQRRARARQLRVEGAREARRRARRTWRARSAPRSAWSARSPCGTGRRRRRTARRRRSTCPGRSAG